MPRRTLHCSTSIRPSVVRELRTLHRAAHDAPAIAPEKKDEGEEEERRLAREKLARLEKRAVSPSMLLSRDKAEDADIRANSRYTECSR